MSLEGYRKQLAAATGFWMSFHELTASYPWTVKRTIRVLDEDPKVPARNPFAYLLALFIPYAGRMGAGLGVLLYLYFVGILGAIAIPAYQDYTRRAVYLGLVTESQPAQRLLATYYLANKKIPSSLAEAGIAEQLPSGAQLSLNPHGMVLSVKAKRGELTFTPRTDSQGQIMWVCHGGEGVKPSQLPTSCR